MKTNRKIIIGMGIIWILLSLPLLTDYVPYADQLYPSLNRIIALSKHFSTLFAPINGVQYGYNAGTIQGTIGLLIPALLTRLGLHVLVAYKIELLVVNALSVIVSFKCFKTCFRKDEYAFLSMCLFCLSPFKSSVMYSDGDINQAIAWIFVPVVFEGMYLICTNRSNNKNWIMLWLGLSLIVGNSFTIFVISLIAVLVVSQFFAKSFWIKGNGGKIAVGIPVCTLLNLWILEPIAKQVVLSPDELGILVPEDFRAKGLYLIQYLKVFFQGGRKDTFLNEGLFEAKAIGVGPAITISFLVFSWLIFFKSQKARANIEAYKKCILLYVSSIVFILLSSSIFPWDFLQNKNRVFSCFLGLIEYPYNFAMPVILVVIPICIFECEYLTDGRTRKIVIAAGILLSILTNQFYLNDLFYSYEFVSIWDVSRIEEITVMEMGKDTTICGVISLISWIIFVIFAVRESRKKLGEENTRV